MIMLFIYVNFILVLFCVIVITCPYSDSFSCFTASCPDPGHPENGQTIGRNFDHNSAVEFECLGDRLLEGFSQAKCNNGHWDQALPTCRGSLITN